MSDWFSALMQLAPKKAKLMACEECGDALPPQKGRGRPRLFCIGCTTSGATAHRYRQKPTTAPTERPCDLCGKPYLARDEGHRFCSADCRNEKRDRERRVRGLTCQGCGAAMAGFPRKFCTPQCRTDTYRGRGPKQDLVCPECAKPFKQHRQYQKFCSLKCSRRHRDRPLSAKRRARVTGSEKVNPITVFDRDGWKCQMCGVKTPRTLRGKIDPRAPELDHIVPLAAGGPHTYQNTQCACRRCNSSKQDRPLGQLRLIG